MLKGVRGRENEARKVGLYLVKRLCDLTLNEVAQRFRVSSFGLRCSKTRLGSKR